MQYGQMLNAGKSLNSETSSPRSLDEVTETNDFTSERISTPCGSAKSIGTWSNDHIEKFRNLKGKERNKAFHEVMEAFSSVVIQPEGDSLRKACKLDRPVFTLRDMPVKEQYKKAVKQIEELLHPEIADKKQKQEQSVANMILSTKGSLLDVIKQTTQMGLNIKACRDIPSTESTLYEKLDIDKKAMESEESKAIFSMLLFIKAASKGKAID